MHPDSKTLPPRGRTPPSVGATGPRPTAGSPRRSRGDTEEAAQGRAPGRAVWMGASFVRPLFFYTYPSPCPARGGGGGGGLRGNPSFNGTLLRHKIGPLHGGYIVG